MVWITIRQRFALTFLQKMKMGLLLLTCQVKKIINLGFGDSKQENLLFKLYIFRKISKIVQNIHICLIISEEEFDTNHLMKEFEKINHFFNPIILEGDRLFSFVFAKVEDE